MVIKITGFGIANILTNHSPNTTLNNKTMTECYFIPKKETTSATICVNCGLEKHIHTIGEGIKVNQIIIITGQATEVNNRFKTINR